MLKPSRPACWIVPCVLLLAAGMPLTLSAADAPVLPEFAARLASGQPVKIVCLGDSVTGVYYHTGGRRAYPEMLSLALRQAIPEARITLINAGISGNTTVDALQRLQKDVLDHKPDLVTVMFGLNDMTRVPMADYQANLKSIVDKCRAVGAAVLLCTPNAVLDTPARPITKLVEYCDALKATAAELKVPVCDCYAAHTALRERNALAWRLTLSDAIHPNMDGHKLTAVAICQSLTGRQVSLAEAPPPQPVLARTQKKIAAGEPVRVLAMPPFDTLLPQALRSVHPQSKVEVTAWPTAGQTLAQLEEAAKAVRGKGYDLVVIAIPADVTPGLEAPSEAAISSYSWILNWSLSFGQQEWDVIGVAPGVTTPLSNPGAKAADEFARHMFRAQDLTLIIRRPDDSAAAEKILADSLRGP